MLAKLLKLVLFSTLFLLQIPGFGQSEDSTKNVVLVDAHYGAGLPFRDLQSRFGNHYNLGTTIALLTRKDFQLGTGYDFIFGNQVKEDVLSNLRTVEGGIIGRDMQFANVFLRERGHHFRLEAGYFFVFNRNKALSGILASLGVGYLRHKIRIVDDFDSVIQIMAPYDKGYDRLTGGWSIHQKIAYQYLSKDKLVNFRITISLLEAFTKDLRKFNYNLTDWKSNRLDIIANLQVAWIIPIYLTEEIRYY